MSAITDLFAGIPVSDLDASVDWYTRFFGRPPDSRVGEEVLWEIDEHAWLFIEPNAAQAGAGRITFSVAGLDALLERLAACDRVRRAARRPERITSIGRNRGFVIDRLIPTPHARITRPRAQADQGSHLGEDPTLGMVRSS
jgi:catechol 2,3-dioxygenase-like lactoylglutathione lyase family enzyme